MSDPFPKISIVLASFNGAEFIEQQIDSLLSQTFAPTEIIVSDDCSTDGSIEILKKLASEKVITLLLNKERLGVAANFKKAVSAANPTHFTAFCDQDDIWLPNKLEINLKTFDSLTNSLESNNIPCLVYSDLTFMNNANEIINPSFYNEMGLDKFEHCFDTALFGSLLLGCTIVMNPAMRNEFLNMPENEHFYHDAWLALIGFGFGKVAFIKEPLVKYRLHSNNVSMPNFKPRSRFLNLLTHLFSMPFKSAYLTKELVLANLFAKNYKALLSPDKQILLSNFLSLEHKLHFQKKWAFEKAFKNKWIQRF